MSDPRTGNAEPFRLAVLTTHPIQYQAPWFRALAARADVDLTVFFCMLPDPAAQGDGFGVDFAWDVPLLGGYRHAVLRNVARRPSVTRFGGCDTPGIGRAVREGGFDALAVNGWVVKSCLQALAACRCARVPCVVRGESNLMRPRPAWKRCLHRALLAQYAACLYIGEANRAFYRAHGVPERRLFFTPYCVDNARFAAAAAAARPRRDELRARWGIPPRAAAFLFCGKFQPKKRPGDLLEAVRLAGAREGGGARAPFALMAGDGELRAACERDAARSGVPAAFTGFLNQGRVADAYAAADCLVLPSDCGETWGLVVNEAMACGLPAIVSDQVGCHPDIVRQGETGFVYRCGDVRALADLLRTWSGRLDRLAAMGARAREHVSAYAVEAVVSGTMACLRSLRGGARRRPARASHRQVSAFP